MHVQGKSAVLVAITAALTLSIVLPLHQQHRISPQTVDKPVETTLASSPTEDFGREMALLRASRSRPLPIKLAKAPVLLPSRTKQTINKPNSLVKPVPRSYHVFRATQRTYVQPSVSGPGPGAGSYAWAHTTNAYKVANCESGDRSSWDHYNGNAHLRGYYSGKWQMDSSFWRTYGGLQYAGNAADASESAQDAVAYKGYLARGWQPWSCSSIMGVR